jgi:hypothetical protein
LPCQDHIVLFSLSKLPRMQIAKLPSNAHMLQKGKILTKQNITFTK